MAFEEDTHRIFSGEGSNPCPIDLPTVWVKNGGKWTLQEGFNKNDKEHLKWASWWLRALGGDYSPSRVQEASDFIHGALESVHGRGCVMKALMGFHKNGF